MTDNLFSTAWNNLHEAYSIAKVIAHGSNFAVPNSHLYSSHATLLERQAAIIMQVIELMDDHKLGSAITFQGKDTSQGENND